MRKILFLVIFECFWLFSTMQMHAQACVRWSKYTTANTMLSSIGMVISSHTNGFLPDESIIWMSSLSDVELKANDVDETMVGVSMTSLLPFVVEKQSKQQENIGQSNFLLCNIFSKNGNKRKHFTTGFIASIIKKGGGRRVGVPSRARDQFWKLVT